MRKQSKKVCVLFYLGKKIFAVSGKNGSAFYSKSEV